MSSSTGSSASRTRAVSASRSPGLACGPLASAAEQASATWLGGGAKGGAAQSLAATAAFLKTQGTIGNVLPDYSVGVNPAYAAKAVAAP